MKYTMIKYSLEYKLPMRAEIAQKMLKVLNYH